MNIVDTSQSRHARLRPVPASAVQLSDDFWEPRRIVNRNVTLPAQFRHLEETGRLDNFRRASGKKPDLPFQGIFFNDSDIYKWLEAAVTELPHAPHLADMIETAILEVEDAQQPDGYLNTYFTFDKAPERWTNLKDMHELYCAGHLIQAAVAHRRSTGDERLLRVAVRLADCICDVFEAGKRDGACGHEEIELALAELSRETGSIRYFEMAKRFVDLRGAEPSVTGAQSFASRQYMQDHVPYRDLSDVTGHAVRMMYLAAGAADIYLETGEAALWDAMLRQWENMTERRMYISGGLGARYEGEAFGVDYELPNARAYAETCAAIGGVMWNWRLLLASGDMRFADTLERMLYNGAMAGLSLDGQNYFYQNPLADDGTHRRQPWFGCACCPPNIARLLAQIPGYMYTTDDESGVWMHLYAQSQARIDLPDGRTVVLDTQTKYPTSGEIVVTLSELVGTTDLYLRVPAWAAGATGGINNDASRDLAEGAYAHFTVRSGDTVRMTLPIAPRAVRCHPHVVENTGRIAIFRGALLYCAEAVDNAEINDLRDATIGMMSHWTEQSTYELPGVVLLSGKAGVQEPSTDRLYEAGREIGERMETDITLVPYYAWANREAGQMQVWLRGS